MKNYRIARNQSLIAGEEIRLEKITTAERVLDNILKALIALTAALFLFNLISFIF